MLKRLFDLTISGTILLVFSVPLLIITVILKLTGEREAFYLQERIGYGGKIIKVTKFVTMVKDSPNLGTQDITLRNDPRVLPIGKFLRKAKLNEFPQFWDVFVGKLALVGWRPLMPQGFATYPMHVQREIVHVKPGLTGIGSLIFRDEEAIICKAQEQGRDLRACYREDIMPYKGALELWYVANRSLWTDFKILAATVIVVIYPGWTHFTHWFSDLPIPESALLREHFGILGQNWMIPSTILARAQR
jgi:lipopolysaccharide/colanic/teichoic acid biosynthesis glycosyltransferase